MPSLRCPNCNSTNLTKLENGFQCQHCNAFIFDPNVTKHIEVNETTYKDVAKIEKIRSKERQRKDDDKTTFKILCVLILAFFALGIFIHITEANKKPEVKAPYKQSHYCEGEEVSIVANAFSDAGFINVQTIPTEDLTDPNDSKNNHVSSATINGESDWAAGFLRTDYKKYPNDAIVRIYYHSPAQNPTNPTQ